MHTRERQTISQKTTAKEGRKRPTAEASREEAIA
jgi:hypothetical protein